MFERDKLNQIANALYKIPASTDADATTVMIAANLVRALGGMWWLDEDDAMMRDCGFKKPRTPE